MLGRPTLDRFLVDPPSRVCVCVCVCVVDPNPQTRRRGLATKREAIAEARRDGARKLKAARAEGDAALEKVRSLVWTDYMPPPGRGVCVCVCVCVCVWTCVDCLTSSPCPPPHTHTHHSPNTTLPPDLTPQHHSPL